LLFRLEGWGWVWGVALLGGGGDWSLLELVNHRGGAHGGCWLLVVGGRGSRDEKNGGEQDRGT